MLKNLQRFSTLERPAQKLFLQALAMLPLISMGLRLGGFRATRQVLQKSLPAAVSPLSPDLVSQRAALTARMVHAADRHGLIHPSCLAKSLTLWWLLGRQRITSRLLIGIRKEGGKLEAHAWVEHEGTAVNEPEEHHRHYAAFDAALAALPPEER